MTPEQMAYYIGILIGCSIITFIPFARKKYQGTVESFAVEYAVTMLIAFIISVVASFALYVGNPIPEGDTFIIFGNGLLLGVFDNFWVNELKKILYPPE